MIISGSYQREAQTVLPFVNLKSFKTEGTVTLNDIGKLLIDTVRNDLTPSLGVTEPGAIAYASAAAARAVGGRVLSVRVKLNSGIYKNSFTCAVPGTGGMGCALAAALGAVCGDPDKKLMATEGANRADIKEAKQLVSAGAAVAELASVSPDIFIEATVETDNGVAAATVRGRHDRLVSLIVNGRQKDIPCDEPDGAAEEFCVSSVPFSEILRCVERSQELEFTDNAVEMNLALFEDGLRSGSIPLTVSRIPSPKSREEYAERLTCGAIEARVRGAASPAMAITGSGSHGILCTLPIHAAARFDGVDAEREHRALLLSMLVTRYIKELSGLLSTACGCVLAGGTGAALGLVYLYAGDRLEERLTLALDSMSASVTGMICHGGNTGCSLKAAVGVKMAFAAAKMALDGFGAESVHGILGASADETMRNMARIAKDMLPVEQSIIDIMKSKSGNGA